jgi:predicted lipid-binding transport protein (Tim44 family)
MQNTDILTIVFLGLAIFVLYKLRSVLGTRTGFEKKPGDFPGSLHNGAPRDSESTIEGGGRDAQSLEANARETSNIVPLPGLRRQELREEASDDPSERLAKLVPPDHPAHEGLLSLMGADPAFDPQEFLDGARAAYEMIVLAFAGADRVTLKDLLARDVYEGFDAAIRDREARAETVETQFVSIDRAEIVDAFLRGKTAQVTLRFLTKLITATRDRDGQIIDGSIEKVVDVTDVWTFARETSARDPNWRLIATEAAQ